MASIGAADLLWSQFESIGPFVCLKKIPFREFLENISHPYREVGVQSRSTLPSASWEDGICDNDTVDASEIRREKPLGMYTFPVNNGIFTISTGVFSGFLNHQLYVFVFWRGHPP